MKSKIAVIPAIAYSISILLNSWLRAVALALRKRLHSQPLMFQNAQRRSAALVKPHIKTKNTITTAT
jgi:hypothetical protein